MLLQCVQSAPGIIVGRADSQYFIEFPRRLRGSPLTLQSQPQPVVGLRVIRIEAHRFDELRDGLVELSLSGQRYAEVIVRVDERRLETKRIGDVRDRLVELACFGRTTRSLSPTPYVAHRSFRLDGVDGRAADAGRPNGAAARSARRAVSGSAQGAFAPDWREATAHEYRCRHVGVKLAVGPAIERFAAARDARESLPGGRSI